MIRADFYPRENRLHIEGHGGGQYGADLACCAVSVLAVTLKEYLEGLNCGCRCECASGYLDVQVPATPEFPSAEERGRTALDVICTGLRTMSQLNPEDISFTIR